MAAMSKKENWTTHEGACASCRTRKTRCGREKPQCSSCCRDQIECIYSLPPKRVNQVKVLSQNFNDISDRLAMMQGELSSLTAIFKRADIAERLKLDLDRDPLFIDTRNTNTASPPIAGPGHVVRDDRTLVERYHGPCTLVALCRNFGADLASHVGDNDEVVSSLINKMLLDVSSNDNLDFEPGTMQDDTICLPPRQFLSIMLDTFLTQTDYSTDIFSSQTIHDAVERVYREPSSPASEPWALCFNLIILLALSTERPIRGDNPFVRPILQAAHVAARKSSFFMSLRLVNVQALALLSLLAQEYYTETFGDSIFAQACILAKATGLHQTSHSIPSDLSPGEEEERQKVFKSLYIRDRYSAIAHGAQSWLPNSPRTSLIDTQGTLAWELAKVQDELERLYSADSVEMAILERRLAFAKVQEKLDVWSQTHCIPSSSRPALKDVPHYLAFLGTRMRVVGSYSTANTAQELYDSRLSCLLVATSYTPFVNEALADELDRLLNNPVSTSFAENGARPSSDSSPSSRPISVAASSVIDTPQKTGLLTPCSQAPTQTPLPVHRLASVFPAAALFILARHILGINARVAQQSQSRAGGTATTDNNPHQHERNEDISLLETLLSCFYSASPPSTASTSAFQKPATYTFKLAHILKHLIAIIHAVVNPISSSSFPTSAADSHLLDVLNSPTDALSLPNLHIYTSSSDGGSSISPFYSSLFLPSTTATSSSSDALLARTPIPGPAIPDTSFDMSQFLNQMGIMASPGMWNAGDMEIQQQQQHIPEPTSGARRVLGKKRARTDSMNEGQDKEVNFHLD